MAKKKNEVQVIEQSQFTEIITKSGLDYSKAEKYAIGYQPLMAEVLEQSALLKPLDKTNPEDAAKAKRISLDLGKICSRLTAKKVEDKATLLIETRLIDGLFNVAESTARLTQKDADDIVNYASIIEAERIAVITAERLELLLPYGTDTTYLPLGKLTDGQFANILANEKILFEAKKAELQRLEDMRIENERVAEQNRQEQLRLHAEHIEAERLEAEETKNKLASKEAELQKERAANEAKQKEHNRLAEIERKKQADILAKQQEVARIEREKQLAQIAKEQEITRKAQAELQAKKDAEAKVIADKKTADLLALKAPDQTKIRVLYEAIKGIAIPELKSDPGKDIALLVAKRIKDLLVEIAMESKKLL